MTQYGQFCPLAKATELIGEKWSLLILRELMLGTTRFNDFQRAMSRMSPTLLAKRLRRLEEAGILLRKKLPNQKGYEYRLTVVGKELSPLIEVLAVWGMRWARGQLTDDELDVDFLMLEIQRQLKTDQLPDGETVLCLNFDELTDHKTWWLVIHHNTVDVCTENPGKEVDLYINSNVRTMIEVWSGDLELRDELKNKTIKTNGSRHLIKTMPNWYGVSPYGVYRPGEPNLKKLLAK